ncbi:MAG: Gldg family protein, partial [Spirochaetales bacterium]|nr:Gldg family protein [Spirochaetales bacterium]
VKVYITENLPQPYNNLEQNLRDTLQEYALSGNRNFNYDIYLIKNLDDEKAESSNDYEKDAKDYGINPIRIQKVEQSEINLTSAYMGMVFIHADMIETIPAINPNENIEYLITSTVMKMQQKTSKLLSLDDDIQMKLFLSPGIFKMSDDLKEYPERLQNVADSLNKINYNRISFEWISDDEKSAKEAADYGIQPFGFQDNSGNVNNYYASAVIAYGDDYSTFDVLNRGLFGYSIQDPTELQDQLNGVVERLIGVGNKIAWLSDHGTIQMYGNQQQQQYGEPTVSSLISLLSKRYNMQSVAVSDDLIPEDAQTLIIARPQPFTPFSDWDLYQIDQFLMKGGNVAVFMDGYMQYNGQQQGMGQQPVYIPRNTGLEKLLDHYGLNVEQAYVMDDNCYHQQQQGQNGINDIPLYFAPKINAEDINNDLPYLNGIQGLITLNASPVKISEDLPEGCEAKVLYSSSKTSWKVDDAKQINLYNPMMIMPPPKEDRESFPLAAVLEGKFTSYFADKGVPEMPKPDANAENDDTQKDEDYLVKMDQVSREENMVKSTDHGKLFVFGSSMAIADNLIDKNGTSTASIMMMNVIDDMNGNGDYALMRRKGISYTPLKDTTPAVKTFIKTLNMLVVPLLVILAGLIMLFKWKRRQKKIAERFSYTGDRDE